MRTNRNSGEKFRKLLNRAGFNIKSKVTTKWKVLQTLVKTHLASFDKFIKVWSQLFKNCTPDILFLANWFWTFHRETVPLKEYPSTLTILLANRRLRLNHMIVRMHNEHGCCPSSPSQSYAGINFIRWRRNNKQMIVKQANLMDLSDECSSDANSSKESDESEI